MSENEVRHRSRRALDIPPRETRAPRVRRRYRFHAPEDEQMRALRVVQSQQIDDPFRDQLGALREASGLEVLEPPYNLSALLRLPRENNMLRQCIDAMVTNVEGHGWRLEYVGDEGQEESPAAKAEQVMLENLLEYPNDDHGLQELRERVRRDLEETGNAYIEVGRDRQGRVVLITHVPAHTVRITVKEAEPVDVRVTLPREGEAREQVVRKTFRRFVQIVGTRRIFFKEFGDPRIISPANGRPDEALGLEQSATEMIHLRMYAPGTPYGVPRWISQMPAILGSRQAELTNLDFFKENAIPAMALLVGGGSVTQETLDDIEEMFSAARGRQSFNRILVIEAQGDEDAGSRDGTIPAPRMELKPLQNDRQKDALFQVYDANNMTKVRSSFRIPPIFVGLSQEYTHATAKTSFEVAESQVFGPERARMDDMWNLKVLGSYRPQYWSFRSLPPRISDPTDIIKAIEAFDKVGALTPNVAIGLANDFFDLEIPEVEEDWGNFPFGVVETLLQQGFTPAGMEALLGNAMGSGLLPAQDNGQPPEVPPTIEEQQARIYRVISSHLADLRRVVVRARKPTPAPRHRSRPSA